MRDLSIMGRAHTHADVEINIPMHGGPLRYLHAGRIVEVPAGKIALLIHAAVLRVGIINRGPCGHAGVGFDQEVEIVLVHRLSTRARRLVIKHAIRRQDIIVQELTHAGENSGMNQIPTRDRIEAMRMNDARKFLQRIAAGFLLGYRLEVAGHRTIGEILPDFTPAREDGVKGNALLLESKQQGFLNVAAPGKFNLENGLTVSAWVKVKNINSNANILSCAEDTPNPKGGWILFCSYGKAVFKAVDNSGAFVGVASAANAVAPNSWVHVAGVVDGTSIRLYLNGEEVASKPFVAPVKLADTALVIGNHATIGGWRHSECPPHSAVSWTR
jgi:hypothetical protein